VTTDHSAEIRLAKSQGIQVALAVSVSGISFGALAVVSGFSVWHTMVLSLVMFSGASQFALIGIIGTGGLAAWVPAALTAALLGLRNGLYGLRMSPIIGPGWMKRTLAAQWTVDESTAVGSNQASVVAGRAGFWTTAVALYIGWNLATLAGALLGDVVGDVRSYGLDAAAAAAFLGLVWPRLKEGEPAFVALGAAVLTVVLLPAVPAGIPVLIVAVVAIAVAIWRHRVAPIRPPRSETVS
jgi:predicted branched-subunit amino acid permease